MKTLAADKVDDALLALPGWHRYGEFVARQVPAENGAQAGLITDVRKVVRDESRFHLMETPDLVIMYLGDAVAGGVTEDDIETAARIDTVIDGAAAI